MEVVDREAKAPGSRRWPHQLWLGGWQLRARLGQLRLLLRQNTTDWVADPADMLLRVLQAGKPQAKGPAPSAPGGGPLLLWGSSYHCIPTWQSDIPLPLLTKPPMPSGGSFSGTHLTPATSKAPL